jgi:hypothetical protein
VTPEQKQYYDRELASIRRGGHSHEAFAITSIGGLGEMTLGPVDPPVVGLCQDGDSYYCQYLRSWDEVDALIKDLEEEATKAWGARK